MRYKINKDEFESFLGGYSKSSVAKAIGYKNVNSIFPIFNPNSKTTIGKDKKRILEEKFNIPENSKIFYPIAS